MLNRLTAFLEAELSQRFPYRQLYNISAKGSGRAWTIRDVAILAEITLREGPSLRRVGVSGAAM